MEEMVHLAGMVIRRNSRVSRAPAHAPSWRRASQRTQARRKRAVDASTQVGGMPHVQPKDGSFFTAIDVPVPAAAGGRRRPYLCCWHHLRCSSGLSLNSLPCAVAALFKGAAAVQAATTPLQRGNEGVATNCLGSLPLSPSPSHLGVPCLVGTAPDPLLSSTHFVLVSSLRIPSAYPRLRLCNAPCLSWLGPLPSLGCS